MTSLTKSDGCWVCRVENDGGVMDDKYSLNNLQDIILPDPPSLWPPATEVWLLLTIVLAVLFIIVFQLIRLRKRNAYRRAGLLLLKNANSIYEVSVILKRVALAVYPREQVASLYGDDWSDFLQKTHTRNDYSTISHADPDELVNTRVFQVAADWIRHHRAPGRNAQKEAD